MGARKMLVFCRLAMSVLLLLHLTPALAQQLAPEYDEEPPDRDSVSQRLEPLTELEKPDSAQKEEMATLRSVLDALDKLETFQQQRKELEERLKQAPQKTRRLERSLDELRAEAGLDAEALEKTALGTLDARVADALDELQSLQDALAKTNSRLVAAQTLPERAQVAITESLEEIESKRNALDDYEGPVDSSRVWRLRTELALAQSELALKRRELATSTRLQELAKQRRDVLVSKIKLLEDRLALMQAVLDQKRRRNLEKEIDASNDDESQVDGDTPLLKQVKEGNRRLGSELLNVIDRYNSLERQGLERRTQLDRVRQVQRTLEEQIEAVRGSQLLSRILREQRRSLPRLEVVDDLQEQIADIRLKQFDLGRRRDALRDIQQAVTQRIESAQVASSPALVESLGVLYRSRRDLIDQLEREYGELLSAAIDLQLNQQQLITIVKELRATIKEQLFWVASRQPLDLNWLRHLPAALIEQFSDDSWRVQLQALLRLPQPAALWAVPFLLLSGVLLAFRRTVMARLMRLHKQIGRLKHDSQRHTPWAIVLNAMIAAPGPLLLAAAGVALRLGGHDIAMAWGDALLHLALTWGVIALARRLLVSDGVAVHHFHWPVEYALKLRRLFWWLGIALVPVLLIASLAPGSGETLAERPLYLLLMLAGLIALSVLLTRLILAHTPYFGIKLFRLLLGLTLAFSTLVLGVLLVMGYEYTALRLTGRFITSLYIFGLWVLAEATVVRGLAVAARRLAYRRAVARRRATAQEGAEGSSEVVEEPPLDLDKVNQQSLRLSKLLLFLGFFLLLYLVWADMLVVLAYLDHVEVWSTTHGVGESLSETPITVADILTALAIVVLTWMLARNLPGLLEVMVLSRLTLKQGSAYAISSLLSYTIVGVGIVTGLSTLGVSWSKLQWLVAALGVGLGFGLQEIFANFISGLIILFERPIRIGDTITLGNLHGTITRIRIRATTMVDFDYKEIIIPNKTFVTEQLTNWSLSDSITRVTLTYGVAHGSDLDTVHRLLHEAAEENERVLKEPAPMVVCSSYGPSAFNFNLYIYVSDLFDRYFAPDEINRRLDVLFRDNGVRVAFNQMDVWLHDPEGDAERARRQQARTASME